MASDDYEEIEDKCGSNRTIPDGDPELERRSYMKLAGVAATGLFATGSMAGGVGAARTVRGIEFSNTLDAVDDLGMDPTGSDPIDSQLDDSISDGTLIEFPEGDYLVTSRHIISGGTFGFLGTGDATFVVPSGFNNEILLSGPNSPADEILFENVDIDHTRDDSVAGLKFYTQNDFHVQNVTYKGRGIHSDSEVTAALSVGVLSSTAEGVLKNCVAKKGSTWARYKGGSGRMGIGVFHPHSGTVRILDCHIEEFGNNGMYASRHGGNVQVEGGVYRNNNAAAIRIHGEGSYADGVVVEINPDKYTGPREASYEDDAFALRGILFEQKTDKDYMTKPAGGEVRNSDLVFKRNPAYDSTAIEARYTGKTVSIQNTRLEYDVDGQPAIVRERQIQDASRPPSGDPRWLELDGVSITGDATNDATVTIADADGSSVLNSCLQQTGSDRHGLLFDNSDNCSVSDSNLNVTGTGIVTSSSSVSTSNLTYDDSCPAPNVDGGSGGSDTSVAVSTGTATNVDDTSATLTGDLTDLGGADSVDVHFEWGPTGGRLSNATTAKTVSASGTFSQSISGLSSSTDYEFRAVAAASDGDTDTGTTATFTTGSGLVNTLTIEGPDGTLVNYEFSVSGDLQKSTANGASINDGDTISGSTATGDVYGGKDSYEFSGGVTEFTADGDLTLTLDGETVTESELVTLENTITLEEPNQTTVNYEFTVSGDIEKSTANGGTINEGDTISGSTATGSLWGGIDSYVFGGDVTDFTADGELVVTLNGETVSQDSLGSLANTITIDGTDTASSYELVVSGELRKSDANGATVESADSISGSTATGSVDGDKDSYAFDGHVVSFSADANPGITLNGRSFPADQWLGLPNSVQFDAKSNKESSYSVTVSTEIAKDPTVSPLDGSGTVSGTSAAGTVAKELDAYRYAGELESLSADSGIKVTLDDED